MARGTPFPQERRGASFDEDLVIPGNEMAAMQHAEGPEDDDFEYIDQDDGSMVIRPKKTQTVDRSQDFYDNLADRYLPEDFMDRFAMDMIEKIKRDQESRRERDNLQEEGLRRTGLGKDAPGGAGFQGASKTVHPGLVKAGIDFSSRSMKELYPPSGPVKMKTEGKATPEKMARADRKATHMNWQLEHEIREYRDELNQMLTQVPMGGSQFLTAWFDPSLRRPRTEFFPVDRVHIPFAASSFYSAQRKALEQHLTEVEFIDRIDSGFYRDPEMVPEGTMDASISPGSEPEATKSEEANRKIEGKAPTGYNDDGVRRVYRVFVVMKLEHDKKASKDRAVPYIVEIDDHLTKVLRWQRNWDQDDDTLAELEWTVEFKMLPWRGAYGLGLPHVIGSLSAAQTGAVRALLDSAHINNLPGLLKLKGGKVGGQSKTIDPTGVTEIEGGLNTTDIRQLAMPIPFNPPSIVLFNLLGYLDEQMQGAVRTSLDNTTVDSNANVPVGTQLSRVEQGLMVFSSIFSSLHKSQERFLRIIHRLNRDHLPAQVKFGPERETIVYRRDYIYDSDVGPVSDPNVFSEAQRYGQLQGVGALIQLFPQKFNLDKYIERNMKLMKIPDWEELMIKPPDPEEMNPVIENMKMTTGGAVAAYPDQDHLAHLQVHLSFLESPMFGSNAIFAPTFIPSCLEHLRQHIAMYYVQQTVELVEQHTGISIRELMDPDPDLRKKFDQMMAAASIHVMAQASQELKQVPQVIQQAQAVLKQFAPPQPMDPSAVSAMDVQRQSAKDQADTAAKAKELELGQAALAQKQQATQTEAARKAMRDRLDATSGAADREQRAEEAREDAGTQIRKQMMTDITKQAISEEDNETALSIAEISAEARKTTGFKNGNSISKAS